MLEQNTADEQLLKHVSPGLLVTSRRPAVLMKLIGTPESDVC